MTFACFLTPEQNAKLRKDILEMKDPRQNNDVKDLTRRNIELERDNFALTEDLRKLKDTLENLKESEYALTCCRKKLEETNGEFSLYFPVFRSLW